MQAMVRHLPYVGQNGSMRVLVISLPMIEQLIDGTRYFRIEHQPEAPGSRFHVGKPSREKLAQALRPRINKVKAPPRAPRMPSLRTMVRYALKCQSAEELGEKLRRRYARAKQRAGIKTGPSAADEREIERLLGQD
jgi:hypothetical protein